MNSFEKIQTNQVETDWREYLGKYFEEKKQYLLSYIKWILDKEDYIEKLKLKNQPLEPVAEDILQNIFLILLRENIENQKIFLKKDSSQKVLSIKRRAQWAVYSYFNNYPVAGPRGKGVEYRRSRDVFLKKELEISDLGSLEVPVSAGSGEGNPYILLEKKELEENIKTAFETLSPREERVVRMHFGLDPYHEEHTLDQIGEQESLTGERIRKIEIKAFSKMMKPLKE